MGEKKWYVLRTAGSKEKKVKEYLDKEIERSTDLQKEISQVLVPLEKNTQSRTEKELLQRRFFSRAMFLLRLNLARIPITLSAVT